MKLQLTARHAIVLTIKILQSPSARVLLPITRIPKQLMRLHVSLESRIGLGQLGVATEQLADEEECRHPPHCSLWIMNSSPRVFKALSGVTTCTISAWSQISKRGPISRPKHSLPVRQLSSNIYYKESPPPCQERQNQLHRGAKGKT